MLKGLHLLGLNGKGTVTWIRRILIGNAPKTFQEKAKKFSGTLTKKEQPPEIRFNFFISEIARR